MQLASRRETSAVVRALRRIARQQVSSSENHCMWRAVAGSSAAPSVEQTLAEDTNRTLAGSSASVTVVAHTQALHAGFGHAQRLWRGATVADCCRHEGAGQGLGQGVRQGLGQGVRRAPG